MIPKKIHYCWFGGNPLPKAAQKCIDSWKKYFPDYEIIRWDESNYDIQKIKYIAQAYQARKYAFVSDYARFDILYHEGGIYFDTDVEVVRPFDDILECGSFFGCEIDGSIPINQKAQSLAGKAYGDFRIRVSPGLGMSSEPGNPFYKEFLDFYENYSFYRPDGKQNSMAVVRITTNLLAKHGLKDKQGIQVVDKITVFPAEYFNPLDGATGILCNTANTHSIHWYSLSWMPPAKRFVITLGKMMRRFKKGMGKWKSAILK